MKLNKKSQSGQIALIILLIMVVVLTIGLSLISRSVTDVSISQDEEEAMRAFSAAEAGIEEALRQEDLIDTPTSVSVGDISANINVTSLNEINQRSVAKNDFININLEGFSDSVNIEWQNTGVAANNAAIEVIIYDNADNTTRYGYAEIGTCAQGFILPNPGPTTVNNINIGANDVLMRIRALCNGTTITVTANGGNLPVQEYEIDSRAAVGGSDKSKSSAIEVSRSVSSLPSIFDYVLFSGGELE